MFIPIILVIGGFASLVYGVLSVIGRTKEDLSKDSDLDKKLLSPETRYFVHRYYSGFQAIIAGLGAIALGIMMFVANNNNV